MGGLPGRCDDDEIGAQSHYRIDREAEPAADQRPIQYLGWITRVGLDANDAVSKPERGDGQKRRGR